MSMQSMAGRAKGLAYTPVCNSTEDEIPPPLDSPERAVRPLSGELKNTMDSVMAMINFIRATFSSQNRLFRQRLADTDADYTD